MNSKIKILIGVLVIGVILVGGWWIWNDQTIKSPRGICGPKGMGTNYDVSYCDKTCNVDNDCKFTCGCGAINKNEICRDEGITYDCVDHEVKCKEGKCFIGKERLPKGVSIATDKTEYEFGEKITATLNYKDEIYAWSESAWSIQRWENDTWTTIQRKDDKYFWCANIPECKDVSLEKIEECPPTVLCEREIWYNVRDMPKLVWYQFYKIEEKTFQCKYIQRHPRTKEVTSSEIENRSCAIFNQAQPGKYKIRFEYATTINPDDPFSREVDIQYVEKEIVIK